MKNFFRPKMIIFITLLTMLESFINIASGIYSGVYLELSAIKVFIGWTGLYLFLCVLKRFLISVDILPWKHFKFVVMLFLTIGFIIGVMIFDMAVGNLMVDYMKNMMYIIMVSAFIVLISPYVEE